MNDETTVFSRPNTGINFDKYNDIKVDIEGRGAPAPIAAFTEAELHALLMENISRARYDKPTPVQKYSIPIILGKRDLMASAQTGTVPFYFFYLSLLIFATSLPRSSRLGSLDRLEVSFSLCVRFDSTCSARVTYSHNCLSPPCPFGCHGWIDHNSRHRHT